MLDRDAAKVAPGPSLGPSNRILRPIGATEVPVIRSGGPAADDAQSEQNAPVRPESIIQSGTAAVSSPCATELFTPWFADQGMRHVG